MMIESGVDVNPTKGSPTCIYIVSYSLFLPVGEIKPNNPAKVDLSTHDICLRQYISIRLF